MNLSGSFSYFASIVCWKYLSRSSEIHLDFAFASSTSTLATCHDCTWESLVTVNVSNSMLSDSIEHSAH